MDTTILNKHIMSHTGEKPYHFNVNIVINFQNFKFHMRIYTEEKTYQCSQCD